MTDTRIRHNEPMSAHTTFKIGGPADEFAEPTLRELTDLYPQAVAEGRPVTVIGNGSNLLVADSGVRGLVLCIGRGMSRITLSETTVTAEAGALLSAVAAKAAEAGLTGLEFASGIPGSLGGAVCMNAGAYGGEMKDVITSVTVLKPDGSMREYTNADMDFGYRHSRMGSEEGIVIRATLQLAPGDETQIRALMAELNGRRRDKQPLNLPSAGSTFQRPEGFFAGKLIEEAGLRGCQIGGAQVSEKHCGFIVNAGGATAEDVRRLMDHIQRVVYEQSGVILEPEVRMIGEFA